NAARRSAEYIRGPACAPDRPTGNRRLYGNSRGYGYQWAAVRFSCRTADAFHRPARRFFPGPPRLIPGVRSTVILAVDNQPQTRIAAATGWPTRSVQRPQRGNATKVPAPAAGQRYGLCAWVRLGRLRAL